MSNIAGKAYAMNLVTPIEGRMVPVNKLIFWALGKPLLKTKLKGLLTLSLIHYARWVILRAEDFPRLAPSQPKEELRYGYQLFFSNFNGNWEQYVDSFSSAIPSGLNALWFKNIGWPTAVPEQPFHGYVSHNQVWTDYYYNAYPMASSNDVKSAKIVKDSLLKFQADVANASADVFQEKYNALLRALQHDISQMAPSPSGRLAAGAVRRRREREAAAQGPATPPSPKSRAKPQRMEPIDAE